MRKSDAVALFKDEVSKHVLKNDKPALREAWNNYIDYLEKDGRITERQASTWCHPAFIK
jgi:hypothetical protein